MSTRRDYTKQSVLEETGRGARGKGKWQGGFDRTELRKRLGMLDKPLKDRVCLRLSCSKSFKSDTYRLCEDCRNRRWAS